MQYLDMENWIRKQQFNLFSKMDCPHFNVCANVDISSLYKRVKEQGCSFYHTMNYLTARAANGINEFKYRIRQDKIVIHEFIHPSFTVLSLEDTFSFCTVEYKNDIFEFLGDAKAQEEKRKGKVNLTDEQGRDDLLYTTCLPWVSFTSVSHPIHLSPVDSIPRVAWGKYFSEGGTIKMPLSVQANHALMDGIHVGKYFNSLQELLNQPELYFEKK